MIQNWIYEILTLQIRTCTSFRRKGRGLPLPPHPPHPPRPPVSIYISVFTFVSLFVIVWHLFNNSKSFAYNWIDAIWEPYLCDQLHHMCMLFNLIYKIDFLFIDDVPPHLVWGGAGSIGRPRRFGNPGSMAYIKEIRNLADTYGKEQHCWFFLNKYFCFKKIRTNVWTSLVKYFDSIFWYFQDAPQQDHVPGAWHIARPSTGSSCMMPVWLQEEPNFLAMHPGTTVPGCMGKSSMMSWNRVSYDF